MTNKLKVLIVDDNVNFLQLAEIALSEDFVVLIASDGSEGMALAQKESPDIILMDVMMPRVSGLEMLRMLLSEDETSKIPVIVMTASHFDPSTEMVFKQEKNVKSFLHKPCPLNLLKEEIHKVLPQK